MLRIRMVEDALAELVQTGEVKCPCHLYAGQEAIAAGICAALGPSDYVWGGHRSHGHYLAKGGSLRGMMAEIFGKVTGCSKGRGGSMHLVAPEVGILGTVPIVAATIPLAVGTALASKLRADGLVSVAFFGDGAVEEGTFHESMNLAAAHRLPVIFVCENNQYASHLPLLDRRAKDNILDSAAAHGMAGVEVDGNDIFRVIDAATAAVSRARAGDGPTLVECRTYRWRGHVGASYDTDVGVARRDELGYWKTRDPLVLTAAHLTKAGATANALDDSRAAIAVEIEEAVRFARESPYPEASDLGRYVFCGTAPEEGPCVN